MAYYSIYDILSAYFTLDRLSCVAVCIIRACVTFALYGDDVALLNLIKGVDVDAWASNLVVLYPTRKIFGFSQNVWNMSCLVVLCIRLCVVPKAKALCCQSNLCMCKKGKIVVHFEKDTSGFKTNSTYFENSLTRRQKR